jgi:prefoldin subunit 5
MQKAIIDTRATAMLLHENISSLDTYMAKIQSNIKEFKKCVKNNWEGLKAHGECCNDLMINLFKGYQAASDHEFICYINQKKDAYDDDSNLTPEQLMTFALNKYEVLTKQDLWNAKTAKQEQIMALSAELGKIKDINLKLARTLQSNSKGPNKCPNNQKGKGTDKCKGKGKGKERKWAWKKVAPKENESKTKKFNDNMYYWCETHKAWDMHLPKACELKK